MEIWALAAPAGVRTRFWGQGPRHSHGTEWAPEGARLAADRYESCRPVYEVPRDCAHLAAKLAVFNHVKCIEASRKGASLGVGNGKTQPGGTLGFSLLTVGKTSYDCALFRKKIGRKEKEDRQLINRFNLLVS